MAQQGGLMKPKASEMRVITAKRIEDLNKEFKESHGCSFDVLMRQ